jgi:hypothetical protein
MNILLVVMKGLMLLVWRSLLASEEKLYSGPGCAGLPVKTCGGHDISIAICSWYHGSASQVCY